VGEPLSKDDDMFQNAPDNSVLKLIRSDAGRYDPQSFIHMHVKPLVQGKTRYVESMLVYNSDDKLVPANELPQVLKEGVLVYVNVNAFYFPMGSAPNDSMTMEVIMLQVIGEPYEVDVYEVEDMLASSGGAGPSTPRKRQASVPPDLLTTCNEKSNARIN